jgi:H+/Na+-translocating ferredoxin:NAD+ oxidoreductase subunit G
MSVMNQTNTGSSADSMKMLWAMVSIGVVCALLIVFTFEGTKPRIAMLKAEALEKAIFKVLPGTATKVTYKLNKENNFTLSDNEDHMAKLVYVGFDEDGKLVGIAVEASGIGFADVLRILYGYDPVSQKITGFYVLDSKETPGLGDKIEKDADFLSNFDGLDVALATDLSTLENAVVSVKHGTKNNDWEIDGITGATISSRAIGNIMESSTEFWIPLIYNNKEVFLTQPEENKKTQNKMDEKIQK